MESCGCPPVGGMYSSFVDSLLRVWRINKAHWECVLKPFPELGEDSEARWRTLLKVHMSMPSLELCSCLWGRGPALCEGQVGPLKGKSWCLPPPLSKGEMPT